MSIAIVFHYTILACYTMQMAGHSKWANIKRKKQSQDKVKGNVFAKLSRMITLAVREGGGIGVPEKNVNLRLALELAKKNNMPKETIERAIEKGKGEDKDGLQTVTYEGFGPGGAALFIVGSTDNPNRTVAEIRNTLEMNGGKLGQQGSVQYLFAEVAKMTMDVMDEETVLEITEHIHALDIETHENTVTFYFPVQDIGIIENTSKYAEIIEGPKIVYRPVSPIVIENDQTYEELTTLIDVLEEMDDVQQVYMNVV